MPNCCNSVDCKRVHSEKHICPINRQEYSEVSSKTIIHHLSKPWDWSEKDETYYFCNDPSCEAVYFSNSNKVITKNQLRTAVGQKDLSGSSMLCYCFGITRDDYLSDVTTKTYVINQTKNKICACDIKNPSGRCCLKDFPK